MKTAADRLRESLPESMRPNGDANRGDRSPTARRTAVNNINPQEFGQLQAQVQSLIDSDREKTEVLRELAVQVTAMRLQMAEASGGWKLLLAIGGASASLGGFATWALSHLLPLFGKGSP